MLQIQLSSLSRTVAKKINSFQNCLTHCFALNQAVLFTTLQHFYVLPLFTFRRYPDEFRLHINYAYETHQSYAYSIFLNIRTFDNVLYFSLRVPSTHADRISCALAEINIAENTCSTTTMMKSSSWDRRNGWRWLIKVMRCCSRARNGTITAIRWRGMHHSGIHRPPGISWWLFSIICCGWWCWSKRRCESRSISDDTWECTTSFHDIFTSWFTRSTASTNSQCQENLEITFVHYHSRISTQVAFYAHAQCKVGPIKIDPDNL